MGELLELGQIFGGRYRVQRVIARGGMGAVYAAEQIATELPVAIKVLYPHILRSPDSIEKFELEAKVAGRVNSEHIVRVLDAGYDRTTRLPFLVMELLRGQELKSLVDKGGPLTLEATVEYIRQVARGLDRAHRHVNKDGNPKPIVHRDLKPENLFLTRRENGEPVVKILDFGLAKVLGDSAHVSQDVKGTPLFMAYEQAAGIELSPQTDIWSLGLTTFYLLTGRNYWRTASTPRSSMASLFGEILTLPLVSPSERVRELGGEPAWPSAFDAWFLRCLDRDPKMRFQGAGTAAAELVQALGTSGSATTGTTSSVPGLTRTVTGAAHLGATSPSQDLQRPSGSKTLPSGTRIVDEPPSSDVQLPMRWGSQRPSQPRRPPYLLTVSGALIFLALFWFGFARLKVRPDADQERSAERVTATPSEKPREAIASAAPRSVDALPTTAPSASADSAAPEPVAEPKKNSIAPPLRRTPKSERPPLEPLPAATSTEPAPEPTLERPPPPLPTPAEQLDPYSERYK